MQTYPPGKRIGQYEIASHPMMGGMGVVYFALDHGNDGRPVAIKTFRPELLPDRAARDRFLREGTAWIDLGSHPHIVRCYKVEYIDPTAFLVLELIAKEQNMPDASLRSWLIPGHPLPLEQALLFALQIARGMQYATEKIPGFVHRDLKPENILVGADRLPGTNINRLRVTDFGLVKMIAGSDMPVKVGNEEKLEPNQVQFTRGAGTPLYMAPEQWRGEAVGTFTDVYALGCILYELFVAQPAASGQSMIDLQSAHCSGRLRAIPETLPDQVKAFLERCLSLHPMDRYQEWGELSQVLERIYKELVGKATLSDMQNELVSREERVQDGWSYNAMGQSYIHMGKTEMAKGYFEKSLSIAREIGDREGEGASLGNLGNTFAHLGNIQQSIECHEQYLRISREEGDLYGESAALGNLGTSYYRSGEVQRAVGFYEQHLMITRKRGDRYGEGAALGNLGVAYMDMGEMSRALGYFEQHLMIMREMGNLRGESNALGNLGLAYFKLGEIQKAINYYEHVLSIKREIGDRDGEANALGNLGGAYIQLRDLRRAIGYFEMYLELQREIGDRRGEGNALGSLGSAYAQLGDTQHAIQYFEQTIAIRDEIGDINGSAFDFYNMAALYASQGEADRALLLAQKAAKIFEQFDSQNLQAAQQLIAQLQKSEVENPNTARYYEVASKFVAAFEALKSVMSHREMLLAIMEHPVMLEDVFAEFVEEVINEEFPPEDKPFFEERLATLRQIASQN